VSIRKRGTRSYQVRVGGFPAKTAPTRDAAEKIELDLKRRKALGDLYEGPAMTVGEAVDRLLARVEAAGAVGEKTRAHNRQCARLWEPTRALRLPALVKHRPRRGRGLTVSELYELASWFPEHTSRMILVAGQVGSRQNVWFNLTEEMLDLNAGTLTIPGWLAKTRREHRVYLTDLEVGLFKEQLLARAAGTQLIFPTLEGSKWTANRFRDRVWLRSVEAGITNDRHKRDDGSSVYDGFTFHMLKHTAASLMALAGMDPAVAAERLEHSDGGALFHKTYRHLYPGEKPAQAMKLQALVLSELDRERTADGEEPNEGLAYADSEDGRYWARTGDPRLTKG